MYVSLNWLKDFVDIDKNLNPKDLGNLLTLKTAEIEDVIDQSRTFDNMVVGYVETLLPHPNADKLKIAKTSIGKETLQIICGGENLKEGMYVPVAKIGAEVHWHGEGEAVTLERTKIRGEYSEGMICAANEIGLDDPNAGPRDIMDLSALKPEIGLPLAELFKKNDVVFEFDNKSLTHRPDLWGHYGIAREVSVITDSKFKPLEPKVKIPNSGESVKVKVENFELCPRYCGLVIENIEVKPSPDWLKNRLKATGHGIHNNIVDITNYIMTELGQPMHAFDKSYIKGGITVRTAKKNEKITTLDEKEHKLSPEMLVIADDEKPVAVAGVIGGENSGINENTTSIILEAANFNAASVRRTSTKLGVRTDSVQRFEKSLDPHLPLLAMQKAAQLVLELCPEAKIAGPITDAKKFSEKLPKITLDTEKARHKIGVDISDQKISEILQKLEFKIVKKSKDSFEVEVPSFRASKDINIEDDLVEEIARIYGYENIASTLPQLPTRLPQENTERSRKHSARTLFSLGLGFDEVYNYSFYGEKELKNCMMTEENHLKLLNYLSEDQTHLRTTLVPNLLKNLQLNAKYFDSAAIYEIGRTYKEINEFMPLEEKKIGGAVMIKGKNDNPFYEAKGAVEAFLDRFGIKSKLTPGVKNAPYAHPQKSASYLANTGETLAKVFVVHPTVIKNHELGDFSIAMFEINLTQSQKLEKEEQKYTSLPKFPGTDFDVSVVIDKNIEVEKIQNAINEADRDLISNIELFDIYDGENIEQDKKAVAFKITLQAPDRTLEDTEISLIQQRVFKNLEKLGGKIRGK